MASEFDTAPEFGLASEFDLAHTDRLLTTTRAVRKRLDLTRPVPPSVILECLDVASQAPSGGNVQKWRWMIVTDANKKETIAGYYAKSFAAYIAPKLTQLDPDDLRSVKMTDSAGHLAQHMGQVPALVIPCVLGRPPVGAGEEPAGFWGGILPAVWSLQLALRSRGLGSAWTTLHLNYEREIGDLLGIPETVTQVALLPVAYYTGQGFQPAPRRPAAELTYWDSWKSTR
jgi:nitroreductase